MRYTKWKRRTFEQTVEALCKLKGGELVRAGKLNQTALAKISGTTQPTISRWFAGEHSPTLENLRPLAAAMGVSVSQLIGDEPIPKIDPEAALDDALRSRLEMLTVPQLQRLEGYLDGILAEQSMQVMRPQ